LSWKEKLAFIGVEMLKETQTETPVMHFFQPGWYIREMFIPAGTVFIGREHRFGHECQLVSGTVLHITESGRKEITAPFTMKSTPGYQMVLQTLTDIIGRTIYPNPSNSRDIDALEEEMFRLPEELAARGHLVRARLQEEHI
jgi:hypothetical protein